MVTDQPPRPVVLPAGVSAWFTINHFRCDSGGTGEARIVFVATDGAATTLSLSRSDGLGYCGPGDPGSTVHVSPYEPTQNATLRH
jgi:hypothetical protein